MHCAIAEKLCAQYRGAKEKDTTKKIDENDPKNTMQSILYIQKRGRERESE